MGEALNNKVIGSVYDTYLDELKNKYTRFLIVMCHNFLEHLIDWPRGKQSENEQNNRRVISNQQVIWTRQQLYPICGWCKDAIHISASDLEGLSRGPIIEPSCGIL